MTDRRSYCDLNGNPKYYQSGTVIYTIDDVAAYRVIDGGWRSLSTNANDYYIRSNWIFDQFGEPRFYTMN